MLLGRRGQFLAIGSYDQMLRTLNHLTWKLFAEFMLVSIIRSPCTAAIFKINEFIYLLQHFPYGLKQ